MPVLYVELDPTEEALVLATLDTIGAMAGRDDEMLRSLLAEVTVNDAGLLPCSATSPTASPRPG